MARFHGEVGYASDTVEEPADSGKFVEVMVEYPYFGDAPRNIRNLIPGEKVNEDLNLSNTISIMADQYAFEHFEKIKYVRWNGRLWTVTTVEVQRPRLILSFGGVYNGPTA